MSVRSGWVRVAACSLAALGCSRVHPPARAQAAQLGAERDARRAPGVAVDPRLVLPRPSPSGSSEDGLLVLAAAPTMTQVRELLRQYFQALTRENAEQLEGLLTEQAVLESTAGRHPARGALRARFSQVDLGALEGVPLYRERDVQLFRRGESESLGLERMPELAPGQIFARVPLSVAHTGKTRLLPDRVAFVLQRSPAGYRIATITEELAAP